jgi:DNA polymerase-1
MTMSDFDPGNAKLSLVRTTDDAAEFLRWVQRPWDLMGVDVETSGLDWYDGKLRLVQFGTDDEGWAIPYEKFGQLVVEGLEALSCPIVGHNFKFDLHWLERHTKWSVTDWSMVHDTMLLASLVDSAGPKGLKDLATLYVHPIAKIGQDALKDDMKTGGWDWATVPVDLPSYWAYGVLDCILTVRLFRELYRRCERMGTLNAYRTERRAMPALFAMERNGMLVDAEYCHEQLTGLHRRADELEQRAAEMGLDNIRSTPQIADALIAAGVELVEKTETGRWKMDADALEEVATRTGNPLATTISEYRRSLKWASSYFENFTKFQRSDGRVHPQFRQMQARTHRMSCTDPAMQTIPRAGTDVTVRNAFVAAPDHLIVSTDFSNVEVRLFAHHANEPGMLEALNSGRDFHLWMAQTIYRDPTITKSDPRRQVAKNTLFCTLYGGGPSKIAATAGVTFAEGQEAYNRLHAAFPGIKRFQRETVQEATDNEAASGRPFIRLDEDGRILSLAPEDDRVYALSNAKIQGGAAVAMKKALAVLDDMGLSKYLTLTVHDEVVAEVPRDCLDDYIAAVQEGMMDVVTYKVPVIADTGDPAERWGEAK